MIFLLPYVASLTGTGTTHLMKLVLASSTPFHTGTIPCGTNLLGVCVRLYAKIKLMVSHNISDMNGKCFLKMKYMLFGKMFANNDTLVHPIFEPFAKIVNNLSELFSQWITWNIEQIIMWLHQLRSSHYTYFYGYYINTILLNRCFKIDEVDCSIDKVLKISCWSNVIKLQISKSCIMSFINSKKAYFMYFPMVMN